MLRIFVRVVDEPRRKSGSGRYTAIKGEE